MTSLLTLLVNLIVISSTSFGAGAQVLFSSLAITQLGILTAADFAASLTIGFVTPGPMIYGLAALLGLRVAGIGGAILASAAIYLVPVLLGWLVSRYVHRLGKSPVLHRFEHGVQSAVVGLVVFACLSLATQLPMEWRYVGVGVLAMLAAWRQVPPLLIVFVGAALAYAAGYLG
jgi:chromate transporter